MSQAASDTLEKVSGEFEAEVLADLQDGRGQSLALVESSKKETLETVGKVLQTGVKQAESLKRQIVGAAELEVRNAQLKSMEESVNRAFAAAVGIISKAAPERYERSIVQLIREGIEVIGPKAVVYCRPEDRKVVGSAVRKFSKGPVKLSVGGEGLSTMGGVVLASGDGTVRFDNTFEARLERMRPALRKDVASLLGGKR